MAQAHKRAKHRPIGVDYLAIFDASPGLYLILTPDLMIADVNDAYARATMIDREAVIGRPLFEVFPDNPQDPSASGARNLRISLKRVLELGLPDAMAIQRYDIRLPDGTFTERHWSPWNTPALGPDGAVEWIIHRVEDVTELVKMRADGTAWDQIARDQRRLIEEIRATNWELARAVSENQRLTEERLYLADLVESSNDAIVARTNDGKIASWNSAAETMYGYSAAEVIGKPVSDLAPTMRAHDAREIAGRLERGQAVTQYETIRKRRDGSEFPVSITASLIRNAAGQVTGSSAIIRDITERRRAEDRMRALQEELIHLSRWNTMGMMAAALAHELNQPLSAIVNYVRAASRKLGATGDPGVEQAKGYLDQAVAETKLAGGIIRSLRDFIDKRESGRRAENINAVVEEALALSLLGVPGARLRPRLDLDPSLPRVLIDKIQIEQVLLNLIRNAIEAMGEMSGAALGIATGMDERGYIGVSVSDNGPGLAPEIAARLFQPFTTTKEKGMGVGLTICQSIIEAHGGSIWAAPVAPTGTCFRFRLPIAPEHAHE